MVVKRFNLPLLSDSVSAGFPSPADDYTEQNIDLNDLLIKILLALSSCALKEIQ